MREFGGGEWISDDAIESVVYEIPESFKDDYFDMKMALISKATSVEGFESSMNAFIKQLRVRLLTDNIKRSRVKK